MNISQNFPCISPPNSLPPKNFFDKAINYLPTKPMHVSLALVVASVALTFFADISFYYAFGFLGIILSAGIYHIKNSKTIAELTNKLASLTDLNKVNEELKASAKTYSSENEKLKSNNTIYSTNNDKLQKNVDLLTDCKNKLKKNNNIYKNENKNLKLNIVEMEREITFLHTHVANLSGIVETAQKSLEEFKEERIKLQSVNNSIEFGSKRSIEMANEALEKIASMTEEANKFSKLSSKTLNEGIREGIAELNKAIKEATTNETLKLLNVLSNAKQELAIVVNQLAGEREQSEKLRIQIEALDREIRLRVRQLGDVADRVEHALDRQLSEDRRQRLLSDHEPYRRPSLDNYVPISLTPFSGSKLLSAS